MPFPVPWACHALHFWVLSLPGSLLSVSVCLSVSLLLLADVEHYSLNKLSLPAWPQGPEEEQIWPQLSRQGIRKRK